LLEQIRTNLNQDGECVIQKLGNLEHSTLFLKLIQKHIDPQNVQSFDVPVFITNIGNFHVDEWDLTTNKVCWVRLIQLILVVVFLDNKLN
jgi:hypothetical protein